MEEYTLKIATALMSPSALCQCEYSVLKGDMELCQRKLVSHPAGAVSSHLSCVDSVASLRFSCQTSQHVLEQGLSPAVLDAKDTSYFTPAICRVVSEVRGVLEH